jgi:hypothetical protein
VTFHRAQSFGSRPVVLSRPRASTPETFVPHRSSEPGTDPDPGPHLRHGEATSLAIETPAHWTRRGGGFGSGTGSPAPLRTDTAYVSDELHIQYSIGMLGSFSPYRSARLLRDLTCFDCQATQQHYGTECPSRLVRVRGGRLPVGGWTHRAEP